MAAAGEAGGGSREVWWRKNSGCVGAREARQEQGSRIGERQQPRRKAAAGGIPVHLTPEMMGQPVWREYASEVPSGFSE